MKKYFYRADGLFAAKMNLTGKTIFIPKCMMKEEFLPKNVEGFLGCARAAPSPFLPRCTAHCTACARGGVKSVPLAMHLQYPLIIPTTSSPED